VGLNTRVGAARFVVSLQARLPAEALQKPAGDLLKALVATLRSEKSAAIRRGYAAACGSLVKVASVKRVEWLVGEALGMYDGGKLTSLDFFPSFYVRCASSRWRCQQRVFFKL
jgi:hypothetical protein